MSLSDLMNLVQTVPALVNRVEGALDYSEMIRRKALPNTTPWAYVLPLGIDPRDQGSAATNAYVQNVTETFGVILVMRTANDVTGAKTQPALETLVAQIINAVVGTGPTNEPGVYTLARSRLLGMQAGTIFHQVEFALHTQLRKV